MTLRILTWNCRRASAHHPLWEYFLELSPDVAVLQEVTGVPGHVLESYDVRTATPFTKAGGPQRFHSVILARGGIGAQVPLRSEFAWVNRELGHFGANTLAFRVPVMAGQELTVVGVYSPAWPVERTRLRGEDLNSVKLVQNPDVWVADLVVAALHNRVADIGEWIVAGDFNTCESFDRWKGGPRGNREWLGRMAGLGLTECLRHSQGGLTPTFRKPGVELPTSQIDHVFFTAGLAARLESCRTGDRDRVFGQGLSDHLPIIADFGDGIVTATSPTPGEVSA